MSGCRGRFRRSNWRSCSSRARCCQSERVLPPSHLTATMSRGINGRTTAFFLRPSILPAGGRREEAGQALPFALWCCAVVVLAGQDIAAQDRLVSMPGHANYQKMVKQLPGAIKSGAVGVTWKDGGKVLEYRHDGKLIRFDIATGKTETLPEPKTPGKGFPGKFGPGGRKRGRRGGGGGALSLAAGKRPQRSRPTASSKRVLSRPQPLAHRRRRGERDGRHHRRQREGSHQVRHRRAGSTARSWTSARRCGGRPTAGSSPTTASTRARSPDYLPAAGPDAGPGHARRRGVPEGRRRRTRSSICSSTTSPAKKTTRDRRPRRQAVRRTTWSATTSTTSRGRRTAASCSFNRTNRRQNILEFAAADPDDGQVPRRRARGVAGRAGSRTTPTMRFLKDGKRFIWASERNGCKNFYLYDLSRQAARAADRATRSKSASIVRVDEDARPARSTWRATATTR